MIFAATGHRPDKLGGYGAPAFQKLLDFATVQLQANRPDEIISGMALGWDTAIALAALKLRIPLTCAIPFTGQEKPWPFMARAEYADILSRATKRFVVSSGDYAVWKMQRRNEWMADNCDKVLALWNGSEGGTANCVRYAQRKNKDVLNLWDLWKS